MTISIIRSIEDKDVTYDALMLWCPGCAMAGSGLLMIPVSDTKGKRPQWTWNGSLELPSLSPSIRTRTTMNGSFICHSFLTNGIWDFLTDSTHPLSGRKVPVEDLPDWAI